MVSTGLRLNLGSSTSVEVVASLFSIGFNNTVIGGIDEFVDMGEFNVCSCCRCWMSVRNELESLVILLELVTLMINDNMRACSMQLDMRMQVEIDDAVGGKL